MIKWVFDEEYQKWRTNRLAQREIRYYDGEANAFYIVLRLIGKIEK